MQTQSTTRSHTSHFRNPGTPTEGSVALLGQPPGRVAYQITSPSLKLDDLENLAVRQALEQTEWNVQRASELLGISRHAMKRRVVSMGLEEEYQRRKRT